jgi:hypothetical protein
MPRQTRGHEAGLRGLANETRSTLISRKTEIAIEEGSTNIYTDLGYADAAGQFRGVSEAKLLELVTKLDHDVKIVVGSVRRRTGKIELHFVWSCGSACGQSASAAPAGAGMPLAPIRIPDASDFRRNPTRESALYKPRVIALASQLAQEVTPGRRSTLTDYSLSTDGSG